MLSKIEDLSDFGTTGYGLKLTLDIAERDVSIWIDRRGKGLLSLNLEIGMSYHHQLDVAFNGEQVSYLIISPPKRLLGNAVEILDFPPSQVVTDDRLGRKRQIGADQIAPLFLSDDAIDDQLNPMST